VQNFLWRSLVCLQIKTKCFCFSQNFRLHFCCTYIKVTCNIMPCLIISFKMNATANYLRSLVVYVPPPALPSYGPSYSSFTVYPSNSCLIALMSGYLPVPHCPRKSSISTDQIMIPPKPSSFSQAICVTNRKINGCKYF